MARGRVVRTVTLGVTLALTGALAARALDDPPPREEQRTISCDSPSADEFRCRFTHAGDGTKGTPASGDATTMYSWATPTVSDTSPDPNAVYRWEVRHDPSGNPCWAQTAMTYEPDSATRARLQTQADQAYLAQSGGADLPPCPVAVANRIANPAQPDAPGFLNAAEIRERLGSPTPRIQPGRAISGKPAYLEVGLAPREFTLADPLGGPGAQVQARPRYRIDWGDGTTTETTSSGGPWPHGDITHVYQRVGFYDVVVTARWETTWSSGASAGGELDGLTTDGRITRFPVTEVQAVRER